MENLLAPSNDYILFAQTVLKDIQNGGRRIVLSAIHISWILHTLYCWERELDALILAPMGHGKSALMAVGFPIYCIGVNQNVRIKLLSADDAVAGDRVTLQRNYIEEDRDYRAAFPMVRPAMRDKWTMGKFYVHRSGRSPDATVEAKGILSTGVGGRCDIMVLDDPCSQKNSGTAAMRKKVIDTYALTWKTRLESKGRTVGVMTSYHKDDLSGWMKAKPTTCTLMQAVSSDLQRIDFTVTNAPDKQHPLMPWRKVG